MSFLLYNIPNVDSTAALRRDIYREKTQACISAVFEDSMARISELQDMREYAQVS